MIIYGMSDGVCVLRLNAPPVNAVCFRFLEKLRDSLKRAAADPRAQAVVITGRPDHFSGGADVNILGQLRSRAEALRCSRAFQETFQQVEDCPKPVVAAAAGSVMGGALELAMACHFRLAAEGTRFGMPEVNLDIVPGAGGTGRLPRLVGAEAALRMLLRAETVDAEKALSLGLIDDVFPAGELEERALDWARSAPAPRKTRDEIDKVGDTPANQAAFQMAEQWLAGVRTELMAPRKVFEAVKVGLTESFEAGLDEEREGGADCLVSPAAKNKIYLFFATRGTSKLPELADVEATDVARAALVGMGSMGTGIAHALILAGIPVVVREENRSALQKGTEKIRSSLQRRVGQGKLPPARVEPMLGLLRTTTAWEDLAEADLVIESVFEDVDVKQGVLDRLESVCRPETIIATNTSMISLDLLAEKMQHPERLIGLHFFNPAHRMPLVEVIRREATPAGVLASALKLAKRLRKTPVVVRNRAGFLVNRMFAPYLQEALLVLEEGARPEAIDAALVDFGFPMGPLVLADMTGLDIAVAAHALLAREFPRIGPQAEIVCRLYDRGHLGQKTSSGIYRYEPGDFTPLPSETCNAILAEVRPEAGRPPRDFDRDEIVDRLVLRMVSEASYVLDEAVARCRSDVDAATVLGMGFPDFRGGVVKYAQDTGLDAVSARLEQLTRQCGPRYAPCRLLEGMVRAEG